jgi:hypothetical protein
MWVERMVQWKQEHGSSSVFFIKVSGDQETNLAILSNTETHLCLYFLGIIIIAIIGFWEKIEPIISTLTKKGNESVELKKEFQTLDFILVNYNSDTLIKENQYHNFESFSAYRFGPYLAYNIANKPTVLDVINKIDNSENLLISFGEIDCRSQVKKITEETNTDYTIVIDDILKQYTGFIDSLNNKNIILSSVVPELKEKPFRYYYEEHPDDFDCPRGTYKERRMYKEYFNEKLKEYAISKNYKFIDFYQYIVNEFDTKEVYYLDDIHLKSTSVNYLIKRELIKVGLYYNL